MAVTFAADEEDLFKVQVAVAPAPLALLVEIDFKHQVSLRVVKFNFAAITAARSKWCLPAKAALAALRAAAGSASAAGVAVRTCGTRSVSGSA
jgi:hypothetical protein